MKEAKAGRKSKNMKIESCFSTHSALVVVVGDDKHKEKSSFPPRKPTLSRGRCWGLEGRITKSREKVRDFVEVDKFLQRWKESLPGGAASSVNLHLQVHLPLKLIDLY
jgi:hypothetical protein